MRGKRAMLVFIILVIVACKSSHERIGYNTETDDFINRTIWEQPDSANKVETRSSHHYNIYYDSLRLQIVHYLQKKFEQKDEWKFWAHGVNGEDIMIQSPLGLSTHKIAQPTYEMIKSICLNIK